MEKKEFINELKLLGNVYGREISKEQAMSWYMFLKDYEIVDLKNAINRLATTSKYFPSLAEIRQEVVKTKSPELSLNAEDEFEKVRKAVRKFDIYDDENAVASLKPITKRVLSMTCSWQELCMCTDITWIKKDFIKIFNREIGKAEKIEMLGSVAEQREKEYKEQLLKEEAEIERQLQIEMEEL